jgi:hypothetical protein
MLILLRFVFLGKDEKPNDINGCIVKSDRLLEVRDFPHPAGFGRDSRWGGTPQERARISLTTRAVAVRGRHPRYVNETLPS